MEFVRQDQPITGIPGKRTPPEEILPVFEESVEEVEVRCAADGSQSTIGKPWNPYPVWPVQLQALEDVIAAVEYVDSQREAEGGGDEDADDDVDADEGGTMTCFFNDKAIPVGDLNKRNFAHKTSPSFLVDPRNHQPLPQGGTVIGGAVEYLDRRYLKEFAKDKKTGMWVPVANRPHIANYLSTDGAMTDYREFVARLEMDRQECAYLKKLEDEFNGLWPAEEWIVSALGQGDDHDHMVTLYKSIAKDYANLHVIDHAGVQNGKEVAGDVSVMMLNRK